MVSEVFPSTQNTLSKIIKLLFCIVTVFFAVVVYARYGDRLDIEWLPEAILFLSLASVLWFYRVESIWDLDFDGGNIKVNLSYNFFLKGIVTLSVNNRRIYQCRFSKEIEFPCCIDKNYYYLKIKRSKEGSAFLLTLKPNNNNGTCQPESDSQLIS